MTPTQMQVLLLLACPFTAGCYEWRPTQVPPQQLLAGQFGAREVELDTGAQTVHIKMPRVLNDSIVGYALKSSGVDTSTRIAVCLHDVSAVRVLKASTWKTAALIGGLIVVPTALLAIGGGPSWSTR
jgi:hypothetical protein